jgi:hypothetical protein
LDGPQIDSLTSILLQNFSASDLVMLLSRIGRKFESTAMSHEYRKNIFYMLSAANDDGWCGQLLAAMLDECPKDNDIRRFGLSLGLLNFPGANSGHFEAITNASDRFQDALVHAELLLERLRWVCRVQIPGDNGFGGTGVLVGPDLVLTNHHVLYPSHRKVDFAKVECLFDFRVLADMVTIDRGRAVRLDQTWKPLFRTPSRSDGLAGSTSPPASHELDYVLLRLERRIGEEPIGDPRSASPSRALRGWLRLYTKPPALTSTDEVIILQHPQFVAGQSQSPVQRTSGAVEQCGWPQLRVRYSADTQHGSSGAPCFNQRFEFVALHHCGDPMWQPNGPMPARFNQGIPAAAIVADLILQVESLRAQNVEPFWVQGDMTAPLPPIMPSERPSVAQVAPIIATPGPSGVSRESVAELCRPITDTLVVSLIPLLPFFNRNKLRSNLTRLLSPGNNFKVTRLTGGPGVGKSYSYELIRKAAVENGVTSACINLQGKSLVQACELIVRGMKLNDEDMIAHVLSDKPDVGPLARKFVRWLSKTTQSSEGRRWWLMLDSLDKDSVLPDVGELLVTMLLEAVELGELPSVHLILVGHDEPLGDPLRRYSQSEQLAGINRGDVEALLIEWAGRRGKVLRPAEVRSLVDEIVGARPAPFESRDLESISESTALILEEVLT